MELYHDVVAEEGWQVKMFYWQEDKQQFLANLENLRKTLDSVQDGK